MAVSGSTNFLVTRNDIIQEALEQTGYLSAEETPTIQDYTSCSRTLNMIVKAWQGRGLNIFRLVKSVLFLEKDKNDFVLGGASSDKWAYTFGFTAINGALASGVSSIVVDSATDINDADAIGILQSDGTMHWTTVSGAPSGSTVTITDATTATVADDAVVYYYTTTIEIPMRVIHMLHRNSSGSEILGHLWESYEYVSLPNKTTEGIPLQGWFDRQQAAPVWHIWPRANTADQAHLLYVQAQTDDFDVGTDDADFPQEWYWALAMNLAKALIPKYGVPYTTAQEISKLAKEALDDAEGFDSGDSIKFQPDYRGHK